MRAFCGLRATATSGRFGPPKIGPHERRARDAKYVLANHLINQRTSELGVERWAWALASSRETANAPTTHAWSNLQV